MSRDKAMAKEVISFPAFIPVSYSNQICSTAVTSMTSLTLLFEFKAENNLMGRESGENRMAMGEKSQSELFYCGT